MTLRYRVCPDCNEMHDVNDWPANHRFWNEVLCRPAVVNDGMGMDLQHPIDNSWHDSKSTFREVTKAHGAIELGNDKLKVKPELHPVIDADVGEAIRKVNNGYVPQTPTASASEMASIV